MPCPLSPFRRALPLAGLLLAASPSHAMIVLGAGDQVNLATIFAAGSDRLVQIDDKVFNFRSWTSSQFTMSDFSIIGFISTTTNQWGLHNVGFDITGPMGDTTPGNGAGHEMNLQYQVAVSAEAYAHDVRLCDTHLLINGVATGGGSYARVDETVIALDTNTYLGTLSAYANGGTTPRVKLEDVKDFCEIWKNSHGWRAFEVNKALKFFARGANDISACSFVRQEFSQIMAPAPGAAALVVLSGLMTRRRRA